MRGEGIRAGKSVFVHFDAEPLGHRNRVLGRLEAYGEHHHVEFFFDDLSRFVDVGDQQVLGVEVFPDSVKPRI